MTVRTKTHTLDGDWRSGAYGANRKAHLYVYDWSHKKHAVCYAGSAYASTGRVDRRDLKDLCYDCLAYTGPL